MKYISVDEYLNGKSLEDILPEYVYNINNLIPKVNEVLEAFGEYRKCNSGLRSIEDHLRIYAEINAAREKKMLMPLKVPMGSKHLVGAAIDVEDSNKKLSEWCLNNIHKLQELGLYCENFSSTPNWVHLQTIPPVSNKTIFNP